MSAQEKVQNPDECLGESSISESEYLGESSKSVSECLGESFKIVSFLLNPAPLKIVPQLQKMVGDCIFVKGVVKLCDNASARKFQEELILQQEKFTTGKEGQKTKD